ncbi:hypothetical protein [Roseovarius sp. MMSF_3305]|uniref:hypothetical protein n=1 Tax=Roseovarius sp. MMSF_3305 TaxID=3046697 RepID=UPI00273E08A6|nr:hypothetical protein [Roseovarius sp. MMSF_3305]
MIYYSDEDKARMAIENEARIVGVINALLIFVIGYAFFLQIGGYVVAVWIVPLSLAGIGACWLQLAALRKQRLRVISSAP